MSKVLVVMEQKGDAGWHRISLEALAAGLLPRRRDIVVDEQTLFDFYDACFSARPRSRP